MLEKIGFNWGERIVAWKTNYENLRLYREAKGHMSVPDSTKLSNWVKQQQKRIQKIREGAR